MNTVLLTLFSLMVSTAALVYLRNTNPKRRRVFNVPALQIAPKPKLAWLLSLAPSVLLLFLGNYAALIMWFAAFSLIGWAVALIRPHN